MRSEFIMTPASDRQYDCGCTVRIQICTEDGIAKEGVADINFCPLHEAAKEMLSTLRMISRDYKFSAIDHNIIDRVIAKTTGEK